MPWKIVRDHPDCPSSKPVGVVNEDNGKVACHRNEASAKMQVSIMRDAEGMDDSE